MLSSTNIWTALNVTGITSLLASYGTAPGKALFADTIIPQDCEGNTVNFYRSDPVDGGLNYTLERWSINCRAYTQAEAETIADAVITQINRVHFTDYYFVCSVLPVIPPADGRDNYNCVVDATLKKR